MQASIGLIHVYTTVCLVAIARELALCESKPFFVQKLRSVIPSDHKKCCILMKKYLVTIEVYIYKVSKSELQMSACIFVVISIFL